MPSKILIMGLPRAGKTTLTLALAPLLRAVHFNADDIRTHINKDLGFAHGDRIAQARRMGWLCDQVIKSGHHAIADFFRQRIHTMMADYLDRILVVSIPNITNIFYGRDVGYAIERIDLPDALQLISATDIRKQMAIASQG